MAEKLKILLAEDDAGIRESLTELLDYEGFDCVPAFDGQDAIEILAARDPCYFQVMISDFRMPRMNGGELLQWCRAHGYHFPVIFITANRELVPTENRALSDCCAALLHKPINIEQLLQAIEAARARNHQEDCAASGGSGAERRS